MKCCILKYFHPGFDFWKSPETQQPLGFYCHFLLHRKLEKGIGPSPRVMRHFNTNSETLKWREKQPCETPARIKLQFLSFSQD